jgi:hypothetical protein
MQQIIYWSNRSLNRNKTLRHVGYVNTNNPLSAYALRILNNRHEYGNPEHTIQLLQACAKGKIMNCWESSYIQVLQKEY